MTEDMRVLHVIDSLRMGGAEALLTAIVRELASAGEVESFVCPVTSHEADPALRASLARDARAVDFLEGRRMYDPRVLGGCVRAIRRWRVDVVHSHLCVANGNSRLAAAATRTPHVTTIHTPPGPTAEDGRLCALADGVTARLSRVLIAPSPEMADAYARHYRVPPARFRVVANAPAATAVNGFDRDAARRELFGDPDGRVVACVARLQQEKGVDDLIDAAERLATRLPRLLVVVAGAGPERERLERRVAASALGERFRLLGHRSDIGRILASADAFCLPSRHEGLPLSLLEAMGAGLPCVATAVGGIPALVEEGASGVLVEPRDPPALADALERVLTDEPLARSLARRGRERVESSYSLRALARRYTDVYRELVRV